MSVFFNQTPAEFQPVLSDGIYFTLSSDTYNPLSTFKFKYNYELYVEDLLVFEGKCSPNPYGLGILDLQQILETYTDSLPLSYWDTTPIYTHQTFPFSRPLNNETINYYVKVGFEYSDSELGSVTGYTGFGNSVGNPAVESLPYKVFRSTMGVNPKATEQSFDIGQFVLSGTPVGTNPTTSNLFLTNAPRTLEVTQDDYFTLGFTNYYLWSKATSGLSEGYYVKYTFYDDQGSVITATTYDNIVSNGGGPRPNCNLVYENYPEIYPPSGTTDYNTLYVGAGPSNLPYIPPTAVQYTVQLYGRFTGSTIPIEPTQTPTATIGATPSPTPSFTPTPTTFCSGCTTYQISFTGASSYTVGFQSCQSGKLGQLILKPSLGYSICSCTYPTVSVAATIVDAGPCNPNPTPTPTPTPTTPCTCIEYQVVNNSEYTDFIRWIDCDGTPNAFNLPGFSSMSPFCACQDSVTSSYSTISVIGSCSTTTPTPTPTPTVTPSQNCVTCYQLNISNNNVTRCSVQYYNCSTSSWQTISIDGFTSAIIPCGCPNIITVCDNITVITGDACS